MPGPFWGSTFSKKPQSTGLGEYLDGLGSVCPPSGGAAGQVGSDSGDLITRVTVREGRDLLMVIDLSEKRWLVQTLVGQSQKLVMSKYLEVQVTDILIILIIRIISCICEWKGFIFLSEEHT